MSNLMQKKEWNQKKWWQGWKSVAQANEQWCVWYNNGKIKKYNQYKTSKLWKILLEVESKTKLRVKKDIWQFVCSNTQKQLQIKT